MQVLFPYFGLLGNIGRELRDLRSESSEFEAGLSEYPSRTRVWLAQVRARRAPCRCAGAPDARLLRRHRPAHASIHDSRAGLSEARVRGLVARRRQWRPGRTRSIVESVAPVADLLRASRLTDGPFRWTNFWPRMLDVKKPRKLPGVRLPLNRSNIPYTRRLRLGAKSNFSYHVDSAPPP